MNKFLPHSYSTMDRETTRPGLAMIVLDFVFWDSVLASVNQEQGRVFFI